MDDVTVWDQVTAIGTVAAAVAAVGVALGLSWWEGRNARRREIQAEIGRQLEDLDWTRLMVLQAATHPERGDPLPEVINALTWHSRLIESGEQSDRFATEWVRYRATGGQSGNEMINDIMARLFERESSLKRLQHRPLRDMQRWLDEWIANE